jgi:hypothetical protein
LIALISKDGVAIADFYFGFAFSSSLDNNSSEFDCAIIPFLAADVGDPDFRRTASFGLWSLGSGLSPEEKMEQALSSSMPSSDDRLERI